MTGRELITYILENHLENYDMFVDGRPAWFCSEGELAVKFGVSIETIRVWRTLGFIEGIEFRAGEFYYLKNMKDPRLIVNEH